MPESHAFIYRTTIDRTLDEYIAVIPMIDRGKFLPCGDVNAMR